MSCLLSGVSHDNYQARWFEHCEDRVSGEQVHIYKGGYWETKDRGNWEGCPDIFWTWDWFIHNYHPNTPAPPHWLSVLRDLQIALCWDMIRKELGSFLQPPSPCGGRTGIKTHRGLVAVWAQKRAELNCVMFPDQQFVRVCSISLLCLYDTYRLSSKMG